MFKEYGEEVDGILFENNYRSYLEEGNQLMEGALQFINQIQSQYDLYIVTNGISKTQDKRLRNAGLHALFQDIFVSEDTGYQKPMKEYFDYVFERIPNFVPEEGLIIGDSLSADMKGGYVAELILVGLIQKRNVIIARLCQHMKCKILKSYTRY